MGQWPILTQRCVSARANSPGNKKPLSGACTHQYFSGALARDYTAKPPARATLKTVLFDSPPAQGLEHTTHAALPHGAVHEPGLTEATALVAAPADLDGRPVEAQRLVLPSAFIPTSGWQQSIDGHVLCFGAA